MAAPIFEPGYVVVDGMLYDADTGECAGSAEKLEFHVTDEASAEWVLEKASRLEADQLAIEARIKAVVENLTAMAKEKQRQREGLLYRFGPEIEQVARQNMPHGKKTWTCAFGSVAFRTTGMRLDVIDEERAIKWAKEFAPEAVKVKESFLKSQVPDLEVVKLDNLGNPSLVAQCGLKIVPAGESMTIKTGVSK